MSFYVSISDAVFLVQNFCIFDHSVWLVLSFRCANFCSFIQFYWGRGHCTSEFELECFCLNKVITNWELTLASGLGYWMFLQFWHLWNTQRRFFWVANALWVCWRYMVVLSISFWSLCFWKMSFLCSFLMRSFVVQFFFIFQDTVWLVKSSWCVHCCSIHQFFWVSDRCRSVFAQW